MIRLNGLALVMFVLAALVGVGSTQLLFGGNPNIGGGISGGVMLAADSCYRNRKPSPAGAAAIPPRERWWSAGTGGFIAIMPCWAMGITLVMMAVTRPYWHLARGL